MKKLIPLLAVAFVALAFLPVGADAAGLIPCGGPNNPCELCHVFQLVANIYNFFLFPTNANNHIPVVPIIASIFVVAGGFLLLTSGGNPNRLDKGKSILTAVVIGLIIIYGSWAFLNTILTAIGVNPNFKILNWWDTSAWCPTTK